MFNMPRLLQMRGCISSRFVSRIGMDMSLQIRCNILFPLHINCIVVVVVVVRLPTTIWHENTSTLDYTSYFMQRKLPPMPGEKICTSISKPCCPLALFTTSCPTWTQWKAMDIKFMPTQIQGGSTSTLDCMGQILHPLCYNGRLRVVATDMN